MKKFELKQDYIQLNNLLKINLYVYMSTQMKILITNTQNYFLRLILDLKEQKIKVLQLVIAED